MECLKCNELERKKSASCQSSFGLGFSSEFLEVLGGKLLSSRYTYNGREFLGKTFATMGEESGPFTTPMVSLHMRITPKAIITEAYDGNTCNEGATLKQTASFPLNRVADFESVREKARDWQDGVIYNWDK